MVVATLAGPHYLVAGVLAALLAMLISFVALNRRRDRVAMRWKAADDRRRARRGEVRDEDADEEDALLEGADDVRDDHAVDDGARGDDDLGDDDLGSDDPGRDITADGDTSPRDEIPVAGASEDEPRQHQD